MRLSLLAVPLAFLPLASPALAECLEEFRAVYADRMDPYARPPHKMTTTVRDADGNELRTFEVFVESPIHTMAGVRGANMALALDTEIWTGPDIDGPWTKSPTPLPEGREETHRRNHMQETANLSDVSCLGTVDIDGKGLTGYSYTTITDKDENGNYFGSTTTVYLDPETDLPVRFEQTAMVSSWAPEPSTEQHLIMMEYDPTLKLPRPEG